MKTVFAIAGLTAMMVASAAHAEGISEALLNPTTIHAVTAMDESVLGNLINWKVGDGATYTVTMQGLPINGTMTKSVTKDNGDGTFWFNQTIDLMIQKQSVDVEMSRADGKILKELVNGQEQQVDNTPPEVISQEYTSVTVPAGTFKAIHIKAKAKQQGQDVTIEEWANPKDTCMDGSIKMIMGVQGQSITMEMTKFTRN